MRTTIRAGLVGALMAALLGCTSGAGPYQEGVAAYKQGDYASAMRLWEPLAAEGDSRAQFGVGQMYHLGWGVSRDLPAAANWYRKAADQGLPNAQYSLGWLYHDGLGLPRDDAEAVKWWRAAADQAVAMPLPWVTLLEVRQAEQFSFAVAQGRVGYAYEHGEGVPQDYAEAAKWYRRAARLRNPFGEYRLGLLYRDGRGVPQDATEAFDRINKAAHEAFVPAQYELGVMYEQGRGVAQDFGQAIAWYRRGASQGHLHSRYNLAAMYARGAGTPEQWADTVTAFRKGADEGRVLDQDFLKIEYGQGRGSPSDYEVAIKRAIEIADQGDPDAEYELGILYFYGPDLDFGVPQDLEQAYKWSAIAVRRFPAGPVRAKAAGLLRRVAARMTPEKIAEAEKLVQAWQPPRAA